jgi:hypothetical protein
MCKLCLIYYYTGCENRGELDKVIFGYPLHDYF